MTIALLEGDGCDPSTGPRASPGLNWSGVSRSGTLSARPSCRGPQIQSNSAWALRSSRRRPSSTKRSMALLRWREQGLDRLEITADLLQSADKKPLAQPHHGAVLRLTC